MDQKQYTTKTTQTNIKSTDLFSLIKKENLTDNIKLSGSPDIILKHTINQVFNLHDPPDIIPFSKTEIENTFLPTTEKLTLELNYYKNIRPMIQSLQNLNFGTNIKPSA